MTCDSAIEKDGVVLSDDVTVEKALELLKKSGVSNASIVDNDGNFLGIFSAAILLKNLIPVPITTSSGVQIDMKITAAPGVAKRFGGLLPLKITEVMERNPARILSDEPMWEAVGHIVVSGEPLCVFDNSDKFMGFITYESLVNRLNSSI